MVTLNGQEVSLDGYLKQKLDNIKMILEKNWDALIIIDGKERVGKSTLGITMAHYIYPSFDENNIAVDSEDAVRKLEALPEKSVLMLDEGSMIFNSKDAMSRVQKKIIKILNVIGQKNMVFIIVLPSFFDLNKWIATDRARFLIHCYNDANLVRGRFVYWGTKKLRRLYEQGKKNFGSYAHPEGDFFGRFVDFKPTWYDTYLKIKQETLISALKEGGNEFRKSMLQRNALFKFIYENNFATQQEIVDYLSEFNIGINKAGISIAITKFNQEHKK